MLLATLVDIEVEFAPEDPARLASGVLCGSFEVALSFGEAISVFAPEP